MKKLFTLIAFLTLVMGAKAANWVEKATFDYSTFNGFPYYVMGYVPEWIDGVMTDFGALYGYKTDSEMEEGDFNEVGTVTTNNGGATYHKVLFTEPAWHQYFIADGIKTELDGTYKVVAYVKASEAVSINVNMGWGWGEGQQTSATVAIGTEWAEVEWEYSGIGGNSCNLVAQPGGATATIEWKWVKVYEDQQEQRPVTWQQWLTKDGKPRIIETTYDQVEGYMGNAETPWGDLAGTKFNDQEKNYLICAWSKEKGRNMNDDNGWDPFPADIEEVDGSHVFVCHGQPATTEGDASAWDNQFWIQSPQSWKAGTKLHIHFRYKASQEVSSTDTQIHKQNPSDYLIWHAIGNIKFTTEWQEFDDYMTIADDMAGGWSIAFNLNSVVKDAVDFYFDDLSWESMVLDEGLYVASTNTETGLAYDFDNATEFTVDPDDPSLVVATVGEAGKESTWINEIMISTVRGETQAFKGATIKPESAPTLDPDEWINYGATSNSKIKLPASGVWKISIDADAKQINFVLIEGKEKTVLQEIPNKTVVVIKGQERDWLVADNDGNPQEAEIGAGQPWDNQFFLVANRVIEAGEATIIKFKYKSSIPATSGTQCHANPGGYIHWDAIGSFSFTEEWQDFEKTFTVPSECAGKSFQSIAFNMAEIKAACDYYITDVVWMTDDMTETLIDTEGTKNFYVKEGAGTDPHEFVDDPAGIRTVSTTTSGSAVVYNLAGQRVTKDYKGIVVKSGKKYVVK